MTPGRRASLLIFFLATLACLGCDQLTKEVARTHLAGAPPASVAFGTIQFEFAENPGGFMSFGASLPDVVRVLAFQVGPPLLLLILCISFLRRSTLELRDSLALALVVGGGAGNWLDRLLREGLVTDFVRVGAGPLHTGIFNLADAAVLLGVALLITRLRRSPSARP